jgi:Fe-S-cluster containining protein
VDDTVHPESVSADVELGGPGWRLRTRLTAPMAGVSRRQMLPLARSLSEAATEMACRRTTEQGQPISCKAGCAACCRQAVFVLPEEARLLRDLVEAMPEPRRTAVKSRFADAVRLLTETGLDSALEQVGILPAEKVRRIGEEYLRLGVACPFLEDERCSIYAERPLACREYLVISPAELCADPSIGIVKQLRLPFKMTTAFAHLGEAPSEETARWLSLALALEWAEQHPEETAPRPGPEWVRLLLENITGKTVPKAPA